MNNLLNSLFVAVSGVTWAQQKTVQQFQQEHPHILFIDQRNTGRFSEAFLAANASSIVYFTDSIRVSDLPDLPEPKSAQAPPPDPALQQDGLQAIKDWVGEHQEIEIIPRSEFDQMDAVTRQSYLDEHALILGGEYITLNDIQSYH